MQKEITAVELRPRVPNEVSIVMSCDDNYAMYAAVTIQSIIENTFLANYTIYILNQGLKESIKHQLSTMQNSRVHIRYVDMKKYMEQYPKDLFYIHSHFSLAIYYRLFIPLIFKNFKKVIYCDCDAVFRADPAALYKLNADHYLLAVVRDIPQVYFWYCGSTYLTDILKLTHPINYFQSGILLFNIPILLQFNFTQKCLKTLEKIKNPHLPDQDVMNVVCAGKVLLLNEKWNMLPNLLEWCPELAKKVPNNIYNNYLQSQQHPYYIHYGGHEKPWHSLAQPYASVWWVYARKTPFYEKILLNYLNIIAREKQSYRAVYRQYVRCRFLARITWGKRHLHYIEKTAFLLKKLQHIEGAL